MANEPRREVLGFDGKVVVVEPGDKLLIVLPARTTVDVAHEVLAKSQQTFGEGRVVVLAGDVQIGIQKSALDANVRLAADLGIAVGQYRGRFSADSLWCVATVLRIDEAGVQVAVSKFTLMPGAADRIDSYKRQIIDPASAAREYPLVVGTRGDFVDPAWSDIAKIHEDMVGQWGH